MWLDFEQAKKDTDSVVNECSLSSFFPGMYSDVVRPGHLSLRLYACTLCWINQRQESMEIWTFERLCCDENEPGGFWWSLSIKMVTHLPLQFGTNQHNVGNRDRWGPFQQSSSMEKYYFSSRIIQITTINSLHQHQNTIPISRFHVLSEFSFI